MPNQKSVKCKVQSVKSKKLTMHLAPTHGTVYTLFNNHFKLKKGFSLVEVVISIFVVLALIGVLLTTSSSFLTSRNSNLQQIANEIGTREIERLRNIAYDSLPGSGTISDSDLSKLPQGTATRTITTYQGDTDIKQVSVNITWNLGSTPKSVKFETLMYRYGL